MSGTGSIFLRTRLSHGKPERRFVASLRMADGSRPAVACPHQHAASDQRPCAEATSNLDRLRQIAAGFAPPDLLTLTVGSFLQRWVSDLTEVRPATYRQHEMIVRVHLEPAFRGRLLTQLTPSDVDRYLARNDLDPQTLRHHRATFRRALADAVRDRYIDRNPAGLSRAPRMSKAERRYLSAAEAKRLIETSRDERLWPLWTLLLTTGLRLSEALGLTWSDIDMGGTDGPVNPARGGRRLRGADPLDGVRGSVPVRAGEHRAPSGPTLTVRRQLARYDGKWSRPAPKTRKSRRSVLLIPDAIEALAEQKRRQLSDLAERPVPIDALVFTSPTGRPLHGTNVLPPFRRALLAAGLPKITLHDLRHSCATILLGAGVPLPVIAEMLGHSSIRVTADLYAHIVPELREDARDRFAEALS